MMLILSFFNAMRSGFSIEAGESWIRGSIGTVQSHCVSAFASIRHTLSCHFLRTPMSNGILAQYEPQFRLTGNRPYRSRGYHHHDVPKKYALLLGGRLSITDKTVRNPYLTIPHSKSLPTINLLAHLRLRAPIGGTNDPRRPVIRTLSGCIVD